MEGLIYRKLDPSEVPILVEMRIRQLKEGGANATFDLGPPMHSFYQKHLADHTFVSWVAELDHKIIATSGMTFVEKPPSYSNPSGSTGLLSNMFTEKPFRRQGIATDLLKIVMNEAKVHGCGLVLITASELGTLLYTDFGFKNKANYLQYIIPQPNY